MQLDSVEITVRQRVGRILIKGLAYREREGCIDDIRTRREKSVERDREEGERVP